MTAGLDRCQVEAHNETVTTTEQSTIRPAGSGEITVHMGKCPEKRCRHGVRVELPKIVFLPDDSPYGLTYEREGVPAGQKWVGGLSVLNPRSLTDVDLGLCPEHGCRFVFKALRATVSASACDQVCAHATGDTCKCSCGGSNHGTMA